MLKADPGWYVNWINPGDAGLAPSIAWEVPPGFKAGVLTWPHPERFVMDQATVFGYETQVLLWTEVTPPSQLAQGDRVRLGAGVSWVACGEGFIPGGAELELTLPVSDAASVSPQAGLFDEALVPTPSHSWRARGWYQDDRTIVVDLESDADVALDDVFLYPYLPGVVDGSHRQWLSRLEVGGARGGYRLVIPRDPVAAAAPWRLRAVIVSSTGWGGGRAAIEVDIPMGGPR